MNINFHSHLVLLCDPRYHFMRSFHFEDLLLFCRVVILDQWKWRQTNVTLRSSPVFPWIWQNYLRQEEISSNKEKDDLRELMHSQL